MNSNSFINIFPILKSTRNFTNKIRSLAPFFAQILFERHAGGHIRKTSTRFQKNQG